jgi:hypothetical protein
VWRGVALHSGRVYSTASGFCRLRFSVRFSRVTSLSVFPAMLRVTFFSAQPHQRNARGHMFRVHESKCRKRDSLS